MDTKAYLGYAGWRALAIHAVAAVDDMDDMIELLRADKQYWASDRLREIRNRMKDRVDYVLPSPEYRLKLKQSPDR